MNQVGNRVVTNQDCSASTVKIQLKDNSWMSILTWSLQKKSLLDGCQNVRIKCTKDSCEETLERQLMKEHLESSHPSESQEEVDYNKLGEME